MNASPFPRKVDVLIVGASHGGAQAAVALRTHKFEGALCIVGEEPEIPHECPPLSKDYFSGEKSFGRILIRPASFWQARGVEMMTGTRVVSVDPAAHIVGTADGKTIAYGELIWAAGPRPKAGAQRDRAHDHR